jgi:hypothetical protein
MLLGKTRKLQSGLVDMVSKQNVQVPIEKYARTLRKLQAMAMAMWAWASGDGSGSH